MCLATHNLLFSAKIWALLHFWNASTDFFRAPLRGSMAVRRWVLDSWHLRALHQPKSHLKKKKKANFPFPRYIHQKGSFLSALWSHKPLSQGRGTLDHFPPLAPKVSFMATNPSLWMKCMERLMGDAVASGSNGGWWSNEELMVGEVCVCVSAWW